MFFDVYIKHKMKKLIQIPIGKHKGHPNPQKVGSLVAK
jgi:hypothetical protein